MPDSVETTRRDFRKDVTDQIVGMLEKGTAPWQRPWSVETANSLMMPHNAVSGRNYSGGNAMYLMAVGQQRGYDDPRWMTYDQAQTRGWQVRKGEHAAHVEFWQFDKVEKARDPATGQDIEQRTKLDRPVQRIYAVFNAQQMDGIPPLAPAQKEPWQALEAAERALKNSGAKIVHRGDQAFYQPASDQIVLPAKKAFPDQAAYYGTALHELAHWTGHADRLNRDGITGKHPFGSEGYAREELRAEMASVFLQAELGVPHNVERHASYVQNWISVLQKDKNELFRAAKDAEMATELVLELSKHQKLGKTLSENLVEQAHENTVARYGALNGTVLSGEVGEKLLAAAEHRELERLARAQLGRPEDRAKLMERSPFAKATGDKEKAQELEGALRELDYLENLPLHVAMARHDSKDKRYVELKELDAIAYVDKQRGALTIAARTPEGLQALVEKAGAPQSQIVPDPIGKGSTWQVGAQGEQTPDQIREPLARLGVAEGQIQRLASLTVPHAQRKQDLAASFQEANTQTKSLLGNAAKTYPAQLSEGLYRGPIIAQTALHVVQQVSATAAIAHMKTAFGDIPQVDRGQPVRIPYNDGRAKATPISQEREKPREKAMSR